MRYIHILLLVMIFSSFACSKDSGNDADHYEDPPCEDQAIYDYMAIRQARRDLKNATTNNQIIAGVLSIAATCDFFLQSYGKDYSCVDPVYAETIHYQNEETNCQAAHQPMNMNFNGGFCPITYINDFKTIVGVSQQIKTAASSQYMALFTQLDNSCKAFEVSYGKQTKCLTAALDAQLTQHGYTDFEQNCQEAVTYLATH